MRCPYSITNLSVPLPFPLSRQFLLFFFLSLSLLSIITTFPHASKRNIRRPQPLGRASLVQPPRVALLQPHAQKAGRLGPQLHRRECSSLRAGVGGIWL